MGVKAASATPSRQVVDEAMLRAFYTEHIEDVQTYLTRQVGPDAGELASKAFVQFFVWWPCNPTHPNPEAALYRIVQCRLRDHLRRTRREMVLDAPELERVLARSERENGFAAVDLHVDLKQALAELTSRQQEALHLRYVADLPVATCAEVLGLKIDNMKKILKNALSALRQSPLMAAYDNTTRTREVQE